MQELRLTISNHRRPQHPHNDRKKVSIKTIKVLHRSIFSIGHSNVTSPQIER